MSDYSKPAKEIVVDLINEANQTNYTPSQLILGTPVSSETGKNTRLQVTAGPGSNRTGSAVVEYNRVSLERVAEVLGTPSVPLMPTHLTLSDFLLAVNAAYDINLASGDVVETELPAFQTNYVRATTNLTLTARSSALVYLDSMELLVVRGAYPLVAHLIEQDLGVLPISAISWKPLWQSILDIVCSKNASDVSVDDVEEINHQPPAHFSYGREFEITYRRKTGSGTSVSGQQTFFYDRITLQDVQDHIVDDRPELQTIDVGAASGMQDVAQVWLSYFGEVAPSASEHFENGEVPDLSDTQPHSATLVAKPDSKLFKGNVTLSVVALPPKPHIGDRLETTALNGFTPV